MRAFGEVQIIQVAAGTVVGKGDDGKDLIVTDQSVVFHNSKAWVTEKVFALIKTKTTP